MDWYVPCKRKMFFFYTILSRSLILVVLESPGSYTSRKRRSRGSLYEERIEITEILNTSVS